MKINYYRQIGRAGFYRSHLPYFSLEACGLAQEDWDKLGLHEKRNLNEGWYEAYDKERKTKVSSEIRVTRERILEAAKKCPQAKEALKTLFPEVFVEEEKYFNLNSISGTIAETSICDMVGKITGFNGFKIRTSGKYAGKGFFLGSPSHSVKFEIVEDEYGYFILVPRRTNL